MIFMSICDGAIAFPFDAQSFYAVMVGITLHTRSFVIASIFWSQLALELLSVLLISKRTEFGAIYDIV